MKAPERWLVVNMSCREDAGILAKDGEIYPPNDKISEGNSSPGLVEDLSHETSGGNRRWMAQVNS